MNLFRRGFRPPRQRHIAGFLSLALLIVAIPFAVGAHPDRFVLAALTSIVVCSFLAHGPQTIRGVSVGMLIGVVVALLIVMPHGGPMFADVVVVGSLAGGISTICFHRDAMPSEHSRFKNTDNSCDEGARRTPPDGSVHGERTWKERGNIFVLSVLLGLVLAGLIFLWESGFPREDGAKEMLFLFLRIGVLAGSVAGVLIGFSAIRQSRS